MRRHSGKELEKLQSQDMARLRQNDLSAGYTINPSRGNLGTGQTPPGHLILIITESVFSDGEMRKCEPKVTQLSFGGDKVSQYDSRICEERDRIGQENHVIVF